MSRSDEARHKVAGAGGIEAVVAAMKAHRDSPDVQQAACGALAAAYSDDFRATISEAGGMDAIITALNAHRGCAAVQEAACRALAHASYGDVDDDCGGLVARAGGIEALVAALNAQPDSAAVQIMGCWALRNIAAAEGHEAKLAQAIESVVAAMDAHRGDADVQEMACVLLDVIAATAENAVKVVEASGIEAIVAAMSAHRASDAVQARACGALASIAFSEEHAAKVAVAGGIEAIVAAINAHPDSDAVLKEACCALANCARADGNWPFLISSGACDAVETAVSSGLVAESRGFRRVVHAWRRTFLEEKGYTIFHPVFDRLPQPEPTRDSAGLVAGDSVPSLPAEPVTASEMSPLESVAPGVFSVMARLLGINELGRLSRTSRALCALTSQDGVWRSVAQVVLGTKITKPDGISWKAYLQQEFKAPPRLRRWVTDRMPCPMGCRLGDSFYATAIKTRIGDRERELEEFTVLKFEALLVGKRKSSILALESDGRVKLSMDDLRYHHWDRLLFKDFCYETHAPVALDDFVACYNAMENIVFLDPDLNQVGNIAIGRDWQCLPFGNCLVRFPPNEALMELVSMRGDVLATGVLPFVHHTQGGGFVDQKVEVACGDRLLILRWGRDKVPGEGHINLFVYDRHLRLIEERLVNESLLRRHGVPQQSREPVLHCIGGQALVFYTVYSSRDLESFVIALYSVNTGLTTEVDIEDWRYLTCGRHDRFLLSTGNRIWCFAPSGTLLWSGGLLVDGDPFHISWIEHDADGIYLFETFGVRSVGVLRLSSDAQSKGPFTSPVRGYQFLPTTKK
eukprot:TRINITY_DN6465_c0_g2_i1.p1 TRINITY_DN6465_c0_g2~~TRINITY_DN6465_c0_g2_i1.p1  ORF type:complete len:891 (+),score=109.72 TRINITY_DN6465_c0_g2_i1:269-2674(+)